MAVTNLLEQNDRHSEASMHAISKTKIIFVVILFIVSLTAFVLQTEFTSQAYKLKFSEPILLLTVTHGSWWILWPLQVIFVSLWRTVENRRSYSQKSISVSNLTGANIQYQRLQHSPRAATEDNNDVEASSNLNEQQDIPLQKVGVVVYFKKCIVKQLHNVYHTAVLIYESNVNENRSTTFLNQIIADSAHISGGSSVSACIKSFFQTPAIKYIVTKALIVTLVLTVAGFTWYGAMSMTYAADVTAIYNCSAFTAYAFAIPLLNEKFSWLKVNSVIIAIVGVFIVSYSSSSDTSPGEENGKEPDSDNPYPYRFWGNLIIFIGAILYGYYEVLYKKYLCIPAHLTKIITPRRQSTFANFVMGFFGAFTLVILMTLIFVLHIFHIHRFNFFNYGENTQRIWLYISGSIVSNLLFSASFLSLMALTSPVLSSVSSLLTIFLIGLVEWWVFDNALDIQQIIGDCFVIVGFVMLTIASWKEISEGNEDDDVEAVSTYSFPLSTDGTR
ncbi:DMT family transporter [Acetobacter pasteurianus]|nr:DMT family transporter [Acetobacter pasteurianus]